MKCKLTKELEVVESLAPQWLLDQCVRRGKFLFAPIGTMYHDEECWRLVANCVAEAIDDECRAKVVRTPEQLAEKTAWMADGDAFKEVLMTSVEWSALRLERGIHPDDFKRYEAGEIIGYTQHGDYVHGPNWKPEETEDEEEVDDKDGQ